MTDAPGWRWLKAGEPPSPAAAQTQSLAPFSGLEAYGVAGPGFGPSVGLPWGWALASHPDRGCLVPDLLLPDPGLGVSVWRLPNEEETKWRLRQGIQPLAQSLYNALKRPAREGARLVLSHQGVQEIFLKGAVALKHMGLHNLPATALPWRGLHPQSEPQELPQKTLQDYGRRLGTLGRGNQWVMVARVMDGRPPPQDGFGAGDLLLLVQAGSRGVCAAPATPPLPLHSPQAVQLMGQLAAASTFAMCNRLALARLALDALRPHAPVSAQFCWDTPLLCANYQTLPWGDDPAKSRPKRVLLHQRGVALGRGVLRGPLGGRSALVVAGEGAGLLPVDAGFAHAKPPKTAEGAESSRWPVVMLASQPGNLAWDTPGFRRDPAEVLRHQQEWGLTLSAALQPLVCVYA